MLGPSKTPTLPPSFLPSTPVLPGAPVRSRPLLNAEILGHALERSFLKLNPLTLARNPVIFVVEIGAALVTGLLARHLFLSTGNIGVEIQVALWLWSTALFATFAEALAEERGKARAGTLRKTRTDAVAKRLSRNGKIQIIPASKLRSGDMVIAETGDLIPSDGEVVEGIATVDESAITGESAPVIRESGGDRSAVTGGARILSDQIKIRIRANPGETFLEKMIARVEGAERRKTRDEVELTARLAGLTLFFLLVAVLMHVLAVFNPSVLGGDTLSAIAVSVSFLVCLIPATAGGLLSAIGSACVDRVMQHNVLAIDGQAIETASRVNSLLFDKTGTVTFGDRQAVAFIPFAGVEAAEVAAAAQLSSVADETSEGRSIVSLAKEQHGLEPPAVSGNEAHFIPFSAYTRMSGVDINGRMLRKGATAAIANFVRHLGGNLPDGYDEISDRIARSGGTPLAVADGARVLGIVHLGDIVKGGMKKRVAQLRAMGIRATMITGDNPLTAAAIASDVGTDDFVAQATPADKLEYIKRAQAQGRVVAMTGDGANDAPALAQADVGLAMNTGALAAKEAGNMVDLDSNPTKLVEVVIVGQQLLITRAAVLAFSITGAVAKAFVLIPAILVGSYPVFEGWQVIHLHSRQSAVLAALIFSALTILVFLPLALRGITYRVGPAASLLRRNVLTYGVAGIVAPFPGIWILDQLLVWLHLA